MVEFSTFMPHNTREQLARRDFFEGLQNYLENKSEGNENKAVLGDSNCTMDKVGQDAGNKTHRPYRCGSNYTLSKRIVDNELKDL